MSKPPASIRTARIPHNARWDCGTCGDCCRFFRLGPVSPALIQRLEASGITKRWKPAADQPWAVQQPLPGGGQGWFLTHQSHGGCVFLRDDQRCAIHAELGEDAKPSFCREFPMHLTLEPESVTLTVRADCSGLHDYIDTGTDIEAYLRPTLALPRNHALHRFNPEQVELLPTCKVSYAVYVKLEREGLRALDPPQTPARAIATLRPTVARAAGIRLPVLNPAAADRAARTLLSSVRQVLAPVLDQPPPGDGRAAFLHQTTLAMDRQLAAAEAASPAHRTYTDGAKRYVDLTLRSLIMGKQWNGPTTFAGALGLWAFGFWLAETATQRDAPLTAPALGRVIAPWLRFSHNGAIQQVFQRSHHTLVDLFVHLDGPASPAP